MASARFPDVGRGTDLHFTVSHGSPKFVTVDKQTALLLDSRVL